MKKILSVFCLISIFTSYSTIAWSDFYVVAVGKQAKRTVLVSPTSTPIASGSALLNALSKITDASITNPYLIIIEPGVYDIGSNSLQMKSYVDMQGSGENVTKITGNINSDSSGTLNGVDNAELRFLTIENTGVGGTYRYGIYNKSSSPSMNNITAIASGGNQSSGVYNDNSSPNMNNVNAKAFGGNFYNVGVSNKESSSPVMNNVTATASGDFYNFGVYNISSSPNMNNVTASGSGGTNNYGVYNDTSSISKINHSMISGTTNSIYTSSNSTTYIGNTYLEGSTNTVSGGTCACAGVYDNNFVFYPSTCP